MKDLIVDFAFGASLFLAAAMLVVPATSQTPPGKGKQPVVADGDSSISAKATAIKAAMARAEKTKVRAAELMAEAVKANVEARVAVEDVSVAIADHKVAIAQAEHRAAIAARVEAEKGFEGIPVQSPSSAPAATPPSSPGSSYREVGAADKSEPALIEPVSLKPGAGGKGWLRTIVPANAKITIDGAVTTQVGRERLFLTPELPNDSPRFLNIEVAVANKDGTVTTDKRKVSVKAHQLTVEDFTK